MLVEKKMFGHWPFCCSASSSVPGAPASSLVTDSQPLVLKPGVEICCPVCVAVALLSTFQPPEPRFDRLLAPVSDGAAAWMPPTAGRAAAGLGLPARGAACAPDAAATTEATASAVAAQKAIRGRMTRLMAGNSYLRPAGRDARCPHISISSYTFQTNLSSMPGQATQAAIQAAAARRPPAALPRYYDEPVSLRAIDFHVHLPTPDWLDGSMDGYLAAAEAYFRSPVQRHSLDELAARYRKLGVKAVLLAWDAETATGRPRVPNETVAAACRAHPDAFTGLGSVDPHKGEAAVEIGRAHV